jgi:4-hydroxybenzoate polyprenyltransferase
MYGKIKGVYKLSRINSIIILILAHTFIGVITLGVYEKISIHTGALLMLANILAVVFTYMINDVEDHKEDAQDPIKKYRNPVSAGLLTPKEGYIATYVVGLISLVLFLQFNFATFLVGLSLMLVGYGYSSSRVRFKAIPVVDMITHIYFLGTAIVLSLFTAFEYYNKYILVPLIISSLFSLIGQMFNQIRDYEVDSKTGIRTFVSLMGLRNAKIFRGVSAVLVLTLAAIHINNYFMNLYHSALYFFAVASLLTFIHSVAIASGRKSTTKYIKKGYSFIRTHII